MVIQNIIWFALWLDLSHHVWPQQPALAHWYISQKQKYNKKCANLYIEISIPILQTLPDPDCFNCTSCATTANAFHHASQHLNSQKLKTFLIYPDHINFCSTRCEHMDFISASQMFRNILLQKVVILPCSFYVCGRDKKGFAYLTRTSVSFYTSISVITCDNIWKPHMIQSIKRILLLEVG